MRCFAIHRLLGYQQIQAAENTYAVLERKRAAARRGDWYGIAAGARNSPSCAADDATNATEQRIAVTARYT
jgi:hypothetical protein